MKRAKLKMMGSSIKTIDTRTVRPMGEGESGTKKVDPFYASAEWKALMAEIIRERGRRCEDPRCKTPHGPWGKIYGDHIVEIRDGGPKLDKNNILLRCSPCHGRKTATARTNRLMAPVVPPEGAA